MRVLIISAGVGDGHDAAAKALVTTAPSGASVEFLRLEEFLKPWQKWLLITSYYHLTTLFKGVVWRVAYAHGQKKTGQISFRGLTWLGRSAARRLCEKVKKVNPDIIITTHFYIPVFLELIKKPRFRLGVVITDYNWYSLWFHPEVEEYFVPSQYIVDCVQKRGSNTTATITGIPVRPIFYEKFSKTELRQKLDLPLEKPLVVMMTGGTGIVPADTYVKALAPYLSDWQTVVIAGRNQKLLAKLQTLVKKNKLPNISIIGWTDQSADYIRAADVLVTKPGGLTTTECLAAGTPLVLISPIPGHEEGNAAYLGKLGLAIFPKEISTLGPTIAALLSKTTILAKDKRPPATEVIWRKILE